ncbi:GtrA family protein [Thioclava sp. GXIMD4215]|uniref:GtrA family protein n=1 Tax=Thioclava sp. GXIMD4215 TaxID=3131928 RepID=UPI003253BB7B
MRGIGFEAVSFALVGLINTAVGYGTILLLMWGGVGPVWANAGGYVLGLITSFVLNSRITFAARKHPQSGLRHALRFVLCVALCWLLNLALLSIGLRLWPSWLAQAVAMIGYSAAFFLLARTVVFRPPTERQERPL